MKETIKINKLEFLELKRVLQVYTICYIMLGLTILIYFLLSVANILEGKEGIYLSMISLISSIIFLADKMHRKLTTKKKNNKQ